MCQRARVVMRSRACVSIHTQTNTCMQTTCASGFGHTGHHAGVLQTSKRDAGNGAVPGSGHVQNAGSRLRAPAGAQRARFALCIRSRARAEDGCATAPSRGQQCCRGEQTPTVKLHLRGRRARRRAAASRPRPRRRRGRVRHFMVALGCRAPKWRTDGVRRGSRGWGLVRKKNFCQQGLYNTFSELLALSPNSRILHKYRFSLIADFWKGFPHFFRERAPRLWKDPYFQVKGVFR